MTYLNRPSLTSQRTAPLSRNQDADVCDGTVPVFQTLVRFALRLLAQYYAVHGKRGPETRKFIVFTLAVLLCLYKGTMEEKRAFLKRLMAKHQEVHDRLYARYLVWRQRKCWMWGGGYRAGALSCMPNPTTPILASRSFAALIPD